MNNIMRRKKALSLPLAAIDSAIESDGPSYMVDVDPRDVEVWFDISDRRSDKPQELCIKWGSIVGSFTAKGWISYVTKTYINREELDEDADPDERKTHQVATARGIWTLLNGTDIESANNVLADWHKTIKDEKWRLIVRQKTHQVRLVASPQYTLYHNKTFWQDVNAATALTDFTVQRCLVDEDYFSVRVAQKVEIEGYKNLFFGLELLNSENGSSSSRGSFILYDLLCTNGMYIDLGNFSVFRKYHRHWDSEKIRHEISEALSLVPANHMAARDTVRFLHAKDLTTQAGIDRFEEYRESYKVAEKFTDKAFANWTSAQPASLWGVISAITFTAQEYSLATRLEHERNAGQFARKLMLESA